MWAHLKSSRLWASQESRKSHGLECNFHEVKQRYSVSDRLDSLAEQHPLVSEALITISGSVRNTATLMEVLVATKMGLSGPEPANADLLIAGLFVGLRRGS
jgi:hypothetical protein